MNAVAASECPSIYTALHERLCEIKYDHMLRTGDAAKLTFLIGSRTYLAMKREPAMQMMLMHMSEPPPWIGSCDLVFCDVPGTIVDDLQGFIVILNHSPPS